MTTRELRKLLEGLPHIELGLNPTPLHRLRNLERKLGHRPIFIKRDDLNGLGIGGNKVRNLEFLLGEALAQGADCVIASGMLQSNLCSLAAAGCRRAGLRCLLVHNNRPPERLEGNMVLNHLLAAEHHYLGDVDSSLREQYAQELYERLQAQGSRPYLIRNGASDGAGLLGYVQAAVELAEQLEQGGEPADIAHVCIPGGNGGLAAGMIFGAALLGRPFEVELVTVEYDEAELRPILRHFFSELARIMGCRPDGDPEEAFTLHTDFRCGGWGLIDDEVTDFLYDFAQTEGIFVEKVYTGKTLYGMVKLLERGYFEDRGVCYLHSGGMGALFTQF
ncbi:MAG: pyridoxal-phosphate dependent enzyme [Clostridiales bacterium]|nr:pyridoxal-phosphate dependent enzyme [Clostridiales bacterium]